jgi:hypothetical protein
VVLRPFSQARAWWPAVVARLAQTLGTAKSLLCQSVKTARPSGLASLEKVSLRSTFKLAFVDAAAPPVDSRINFCAGTAERRWRAIKNAKIAGFTRVSGLLRGA